MTPTPHRSRVRPSAAQRLVAVLALILAWVLLTLLVFTSSEVGASAFGLAPDVAWAASSAAVLVLLLVVSTHRGLDGPAPTAAALTLLALGTLLVALASTDPVLDAAALVGAVGFEESLFRAAPLLVSTLLFGGRHLVTLGVVSSVVFLVAHELTTPALVANKVAFTALFLAVLVCTRSVAGAVLLHTVSNTLWILLEPVSSTGLVLLLDFGLILLGSGLVVRHLVQTLPDRTASPVTTLIEHRKALT